MTATASCGTEEMELRIGRHSLRGAEHGREVRR